MENNIQHRICCNKANKNEISIIERIIDGVTFQMHVCENHYEEFRYDGKELEL